MEKRIGAVIILVKDKQYIPQINQLLSRYSEIIQGRLGIPFKEEDISVISIVLNGTTDEVGALTGQIGKLKGVQVKSALIKS